MWIVQVKYKKSLDQVNLFLAEHREFLDLNYSRKLLFASGPLVPRVGGVILVKAMPEEELKALFALDPFYREEIADYSWIEFQALKGIPELIESS